MRGGRVRAKIFTKSIQDDRLKNVLHKFALGIRASGDFAEISDATEYSDCDIAIFFGSWKDRLAEHHILKNDIVKNVRNFIVLETPLIGRMPVQLVMPDQWFRIGLNGFLADTGLFNNKNCDSHRWEKISRDLKIEPKSYTNQNGPIVIALQLPGDASLKGEIIERWASVCVREIRQQTERPIIIRTPQLVSRFQKKWISDIAQHDKIIFQQGTAANLIETISTAFCTVTYSSGFAIDSLLNGCPTVAMSPSSFCYDIAQNNVQKIEMIGKPDRAQWLNDLSYAQWHENEIEQGSPWRHLKQLL